MKDHFLSTDSSSGSERSSIGSSSARRSEGGEQRRMVDITRDKPIKVTVRVVVPVRDHPKVSEKKDCLCMEGQSGA
jgi:KH domain-containing RNA-binding signal transduction-associated protein 3